MQDHRNRNFASFLAYSLLESGERGCLLAFVFDGLLQSCPEIFDQPKGSDSGRVGFFGNELDLLMQEVEGVLALATSICP